MKKQVNELSKQYDTLHDLLVDQVEKNLKRIFEISQENNEYEHTYNINYNMYQEVLNNEDAIAKSVINDINKLLSEKKYKIIKEELETVKDKINALNEKCEQVNASVGELISVDESNKQDLLVYRHEFSSIKDEYELKRNELRFIESSFINVFDKMEEHFTEAEKCLLGAHYVESKMHFPEMERVMKALRKSIVILPKLCTLSHVVVPNSINELSDRYNSMVEQGYPLHHLKFQSILELFNNTLESIYSKLLIFSTKNVEYELNQIKDVIQKIHLDLDNEVSAREYFKENYENIYYGCNKIENKFVKLRKDLPKYKNTYLLRSSCVIELDRVENGVTDLALIKRTLDTYVHSASSQPYSVLKEKLLDLLHANEQIERDIDEIQDYLVSLKNDTNNGYQYFTKLYVELKKCESQIRKYDIPLITSKFNEKFADCYEVLIECGNLVNNLPINVSSLNENVAKLKLYFERINEEISSIEETIYKAEQSIVYANQYRQGFDDVKTTLQRVEKLFFEGDFVKANNETVNMVKKIRPDSGK